MKIKRVGCALILILALLSGGLYLWGKQQLETPVSALTVKSIRRD